jgi:phage-related tail protein
LKSSEITQLTTQAKSLEIQVKEYKSKYSAEQEKVTLKQRELEAAKEEIPSARIIGELENQLKTAETKSSVMTADAQFTIHRNHMIKAYDKLLKILIVLERTDPETKEKYRETASTLAPTTGKPLISQEFFSKMFRIRSFLKLLSDFFFW